MSKWIKLYCKFENSNIYPGAIRYYQVLSEGLGVYFYG